MSRLREAVRGFTDPRPARASQNHVRNGAILVGVVAFVCYCAFTANIPLIRGEPGKPVRAEFAATNQVDDETPVRVAGVEVGKVKKVEAAGDPRRGSVVTFRVTDDGVSVRRDARAEIRWKTLLGGEMYIDLHPGSPSAPELGDATIPASRTSSQVELDDVLRPYNGNTEQAQRGVLKGLAVGFGTPGAAGKSLETLPALRTVERGMRPLRGRARDDVRMLTAATAKTVEALGEDPAALQGLVSGADRTLRAVRNRREDLGELIERSPATLDDTAVTMTRLRATLDHLDPLVSRLRPAARELAPASNTATPALRQANALLAQARPLLRNARPAFANLERAGRAGAPLLRKLNPILHRVDSEVIPFLNTRDEETKLRTFEAIGPFFAAAGGAGAEFDKEGYRFRLTVPSGSNSGVTVASAAMARDCQRSLPRSKEGGCAALAKVLATGWYGRDRRRR